jgi:hypothetical protein
MISTAPVIYNEPRPWAFSQAELTAGLRSHTGDPRLTIISIAECAVKHSRPSVGRIRGLEVLVLSKGRQRKYQLVLKEPRGSSQIATAGNGRREILFYRNLGDQIPIPIPSLIAAHSDGEWLLLNLLPSTRRAEKWTAGDYLLAVENLVVLHDRFWNLNDPLRTYPWLSRPLDSDSMQHLHAARGAANRIGAEANQANYLDNPELNHIIQVLVENSDSFISRLKQSPQTLLHGDYWPGNLSLQKRDQLAAYDWQQAGIGPGILDMVAMIQNSLWWFGKLPLPAAHLLSRYRAEIQKLNGYSWSEEQWSDLWDLGLLWVFLKDWLVLLTNIPGPVLNMRIHQIKTVWFEPVRLAMERQIGKRPAWQSEA